MADSNQDPFRLQRFQQSASKETKARWNAQPNPMANWLIFQVQLGNFIKPTPKPKPSARKKVQPKPKPAPVPDPESSSGSDTDYIPEFPDIFDM